MTSLPVARAAPGSDGTVSSARSTPDSGNPSRLRRVLLVCGILSSLLYVAMNVFVAMQWEDYSSFSKTVSELSA